MNKKIFSIIASFTVAALLLVSCKSTPDPAVLEAAIGNADEARQKASDFDAPAYFPSEWEAAEAVYNAAGEIPVSSASEQQAAVDAYNASAEVYEDLFQKAVPLYAQAREDELMEKRSELIGTGFTQYFPDYLEIADGLALSASEQFENGDYYKAKDTAAQAMEEYETLLAGAKVYLTRQEILDRGFKDYDSDNFEKADEVVQTAMSQYEAGNKEAAVASAEEALLRYNIVLANGWTAYSLERRNAASQERALAVSEKVNTASREAFREADGIFNTAEETYSAQIYNEAALLYTDAEARFAIARIDTEEKRQRALNAIRTAEEKIDESNEAAIEAERIIEGGVSR